MRGVRRSGIGVAALVAALAAAPAALAAPAEPQRYEVAMLGSYAEQLETVPEAPSGIGGLQEVVGLRWQARTAVAAPLRSVGVRGAAITARLTGAVTQYRRARSGLVDVGGLACLRVENAALDPARAAPRLTLTLAGTLTTRGSARLQTSPGPLPVLVSSSVRCGPVTPDPERPESLPLRPLMLPPAARLGELLHVPAATVRRGRPFEVERTVVVEEPVAAGTTRVRRWSLLMSFSPCLTDGC